jgi:ribose-phosphate pyrophosphokinase
MEIKKYPDGTSYVVLRDGIEGMKQANESGFRYFQFKLNSYEDLWHLNQFVDAFNHYHKKKPMILIPNLIDAQADRRFGKNESSGLKLVCKFLNDMDATFKIFHPHNPEVVEALIDDVVIMDNSKFIGDVLSNIYCTSNEVKQDLGIYYHVNHDMSNLILMSSDAGGFKPLIKLCDAINWKGETFSASKSRLTGHSEARMIQRVDREDFEGKDILIVDDICVNGGTFKGLSKLLRKKNCGKLYLAVSHMTIQELGEDPVTDYFDKVFTTNSKFDEYNYLDEGGYCYLDNFELIKMFD